MSSCYCVGTPENFARYVKDKSSGWTLIQRAEDVFGLLKEATVFAIGELGKEHELILEAFRSRGNKVMYVEI